MPASAQEISELVTNPQETLSVELKGWIDLTSAAGKAKVVKTCIALRNADGGFMVIGIEDKTLKVQASSEPTDVRRTFHPDQIQALVTKYASEPVRHLRSLSGSRWENNRCNPS